MPKYNWIKMLALSVFSVGCVQLSSYKTDSEALIKGAEIFEMQCASCHNFKGPDIGPDLTGITLKVSYEWLRGFIQNAQEKSEQEGERSRQLYAEYKVYMPSFNHLSGQELDAVLAYINSQDPKPNDFVGFGRHIENPIPDTIANSGKTLQLELVMQAPATSKIKPRARINKISSIPDSKRNFINDLNGVLYELREDDLVPVLDIKKHFKKFVSKPGLGSGFGSFAFHPEYTKNGLFYTSHTEQPDPLRPVDFGFHDVISEKNAMRWILTEWKQGAPEKTEFVGTKRLLLSIDMVSPVHGVQEITFNPLSKKGEEDYGKLYISVGDGGSAQKKYTAFTQNKYRIWGTILRINPLGNNSKNKRYGIPEENPFVYDKNALGEIWAYGFRNPHKITWDANNGNMLASDIGQHQVEEINLIEKGKNYGWPKREGTFRIFTETNMKYVYRLDEKDKESFTYPVAQFDHDEAGAISGGYVYYGKGIPELQGKYIFGSIAEGRVFMTEAKNFQLGSQVPIEELNIALGGISTSFRALTKNGRVDFRVSPASSGELFVYTKSDGKIYMIVGIK